MDVQPPSNRARQQLILKCFQRGATLTPTGTAPAYRQSLDGLLRWLMQADQVTSDQTTLSLKLSHNTSAAVISKQAGLVAGGHEAPYLLKQNTQIEAQA